MFTVPSAPARARRRLTTILASALAFAIGLSGLSAIATLETAAAAAANPLAPLKGFTIVTKNDATFGNSGEIEGSLAVGRNLVFQQYNLAVPSDGSPFPTADGLGNVALFVGGTATYPGSGKFDVNGGGLARITDTSGMSVSADSRLYGGGNQNAYVKSQANTQTTVAGNAAASYTATAGAFAAAFPASAFQTLIATSSSYAAITTSGGGYVVIPAPTSNGGEPVLTLTSGKINVWNVSSSYLAGKTAFQFANNVRPSATTPLIINVQNNSGGTMNAVRLGDTTTARSTLWNFSGWTALEITGSAQLNGSLLAPGAAVKNSNGSETNGQIVADSFVANTGAEVHHYGFSFDVPEKTVVAGSWSTTTECAAPSNQLLVNAVAGVKYTWTQGGSGDFTSFSKSGLTGTYAFTVSVTDPSLYTLGSNPSSYSVTFTSSTTCNPPTVTCIPNNLVTYTYDQATNSGTVTVPPAGNGYSDTLCNPFWVTAVAWTYTKNTTWPQQLVTDNAMSNNAGGTTISKSGVYSYGAPVECGQGDIYASFVDQRTTSPKMQGHNQLNGPNTPFKEFFLHGMGFSGPTPTYMQSPLGCNKVTPEPVTAVVVPAQSCDVAGSLTVGSGAATAVLTSARPTATVRGVIYTLTQGNGTTGAWEVTASPATNKYFDGTSQTRTYSGDLGTSLTCATPTKPALTNAQCDAGSGVVTDAFAVIPSNTNFLYKKGTTVLAEGSKVTLPAGTTTVVTVEAKPGFTNTGVSSFTFTPEQIDCDQPVEYVAPTFTDQVCDVPTGGVSGATLVFTRTANVGYRVDGVPVVFADGANTATVPVAVGARTVTVTAADGYFLSGTAQKKSVDLTFTVTKPATCDQPVAYVAPTVTDEVCNAVTGDISDATLTFTRTARLTYAVDGTTVVFPAGRDTVTVPVEPGTRVVTVTAAKGYFLQGTANLTTKDYDVTVAAAGRCDKPVEYVAPKSAQEVCDAVDGGVKDGSVVFETIPANLSYVFDGEKVAAGDSFLRKAGTYELVVTAADGYFIAGADSEETYSIVVAGPGTACDESVEYVAPKVAQEVCDAVDGGVKDGSVVFETIPANLSYVFNGTPVVKGDAFTLPKGDYTLTVTAGAGYFLPGGAKTADYTVSVAAPSTDCDQAVEYVAPAVTLEVCDTVNGGTANGSVVFDTIPTNLSYVFNGSPVAAGDVVSVPKGGYDLVVTAAPGYFLKGGGSTATYTIQVGGPKGTCDEVVLIPLDPFASPEVCSEPDPVTGASTAVDGSITIVYVANVTWEISEGVNGARTPVTVTSPRTTFAYPAGDYVVWATPAPGYLLKSPTSFAVKVAAPAFRCDLGTFGKLPTAASWTSQTCETGGLVGPTITVEPFPGVTYFLDGTALTRTTTTVAPGTYTLTAAPDDPNDSVTQDTWPPIVLTAASTVLCGDLTTLALTGGTPGGWLILAIVLLQAGLVLVAVRFVRARRARHLV